MPKKVKFNDTKYIKFFYSNDPPKFINCFFNKKYKNLFFYHKKFIGFLIILLLILLSFNFFKIYY